MANGKLFFFFFFFVFFNFFFFLLVLHPMCGRVITGARSGVVEVWSLTGVETKKPQISLLRAFHAHRGAVTCVAVSRVFSIFCSGRWVIEVAYGV